jgi:cytochrome c oxidase cbb3-type subunit 2
MHFTNPRDISYDSIMPQYAYLFRDGRGDALLAYLASLNSPESTNHLNETAAAWNPPPAAIAEGDRLDGKKLFREHCATCHESNGQARIKWSASFTRLPPNLVSDTLLYVPNDRSFEQRRAQIAKIIKFGLPKTNMAGHEYLPDSQIEAISKWVADMRPSKSHEPQAKVSQLRP